MNTTVTVSSTAALYAALANAQGGETIKLAAGNYGDFNLSAKSGFDITFASNVTITSADPAHAASFIGIDLRGVTNLTLDGLRFDYTFAKGDPIYERPFTVTGGQNIAILNSTFDGDVAKGVSTAANGYGYAIGLSVRGVTNATVEGNEFSNFHRGLVVNDSKQVVVVGNDVHSMRMDGMNFSDVQGAVIEGNRIHDFRGSPTSVDHSDMIQFWTSGTKEPSTDIVIRGNVLDIGSGSATQSIFMRNDMVDRGLAGKEMYYRNVTIENNVITNGHMHGITVGETAGLVIKNNSVLHADGGKQDGADDSVEIPRIAVATNSNGVTIANNITSMVSGWSGQAGWTVNKNAFVQDQNAQAPGFYKDVFISSTLTPSSDGHKFLALPGGMVDKLNAGAAATLDWAPKAAAVAALFQVAEHDGGSGLTRIFDAAQSITDLGALPKGAVFEWNFGDGTVGRGQKVVHHFADGGLYDVTLKVSLPNGVNDTEHSKIGVQDATILSMSKAGIFTASELGKDINLAKSAFAGADGLQLGAKGAAATIAQTHIADIFGAEDFNISLRMDADVKGSSGELFRLHGSIITTVGSKGDVQVQAFSDTGAVVKLMSKGVKVNDLAKHDIDIRLDDGRLQLWVDDKLAADSAFSGHLNAAGNHNLTFGNPWGKSNFNGDLSEFNISTGEVLPAMVQTSAWTAGWDL